MIKAIAVCGPTASGKTALSLDLAEALSAEIVSCDSMQIYRDMNIGTAKATEEERARIAHHLVDFLSPKESYSAERYRKEALGVMSDITARGKLPLLVGGTGLYLDTLLRGEQSEVPESDPEYREKELSKIKNQDDAHALWEKLRLCDPESSEAIHENNVRRVIRALEIYERTGKPKSYFDKMSKEQSRDINILVLSLDFHNRENLYARVDLRVDKMMKDGLLDEVRSLYERGLLDEGTTASQAIGYKELVSYIKGECTLEFAVDVIKQSTRRYAKRQLTWFRHVDAEKIMLDTEEGKLRAYRDILREALEICQNNSI